LPLGVRRRTAVVGGRGWRGRLFGAVEFEFVGGQQLGQQLPCSDDAVADRGQQTVDLTVGEFLEHSLEALAGAQLRDRQPKRLKLAVNERDAPLDRALGLLRAQPLANAALGARGDREAHPILARTLPLRGDDFDRIA
jgi:hypothetical protein